MPSELSWAPFVCTEMRTSVSLWLWSASKHFHFLVINLLCFSSVSRDALAVHCFPPWWYVQKTKPSAWVTTSSFWWENKNAAEDLDETRQNISVHFLLYSCTCLISTQKLACSRTANFLLIRLQNTKFLSRQSFRGMLAYKSEINEGVLTIEGVEGSYGSYVSKFGLIAEIGWQSLLCRCTFSCFRWASVAPLPAYKCFLKRMKSNCRNPTKLNDEQNCEADFNSQPETKLSQKGKDNIEARTNSWETTRSTRV